MVTSVEKLQELEINDCEMMTEIVAEDEGEGDEKAMDKFEFPQLSHLALWFLPNLVSFSPKVNTTALIPKAIDVDSREILPEFDLHTQIQHLFNEKVAFPSLEELELVGCGSLRSVFYPSMARGLVHLQHLDISQCKMMEEIVVKGENEEGRTDKIVIPRLEKLELDDLPSLTSFCQGPYPFDLPSLVHVSINQCPKMTTFSLNSPFTPKLQKVEEGFYSGKSFWMGDLNKTIQQLFVRKFTFPGATKLRLSHNDDVELILYSLQPDGSLCKLREMHVEECNKLLHVIPSNFLQSFGNLEELTVLSCTSLVKVFEVEGLNIEERDTVLLPTLEKLHLKDLNVKVLFPSLEKLILFEGLKSVRVECCGSLRNLFYPLMVRGLVHLEELVVEHCNMMEEIISKGEEEEERMNTITVIPQLKRLELYHLPNLVSFCQGRYAFDLPSLVDVFVFDCPKMKTSSGFVSTKRLNQVHNHDKRLWMRSDIRQSYWMGDLNNTIQQLFQTKFTFHGTTKFEHILHSLPPDRSLCKLRVMHMQECNNLSIAVPSNLLSALQNLEELSIEECDSLVEVFEVEGLNVEEGDRVLLPNLKKLIFQDLPKLKHIVKREPKGFLFFQRLEVLQVWRCNCLRNLFSPSMVQSVEQLQELQISVCRMMTEIVAKDEGEGDEKAMDKIEFPQLRRLTLWELPNLVSFSPKVNTTALNPKAINLDSGEFLPKFNLLIQFQHLFNEKVAFPRLEELVLTGVSKINEIWCKMDHKGTIGFQYLKSLRVSDCGRLRNVFYPSMARSLVHLEDLSIFNCKWMKEIVVKGENEEKERTDKIVIPQLEKLELSDLRRLISFCEGLYSFDLPSLMHLSIDQCPKMMTFSLDSPITPKLQKVDEGYYSGKSFWMGDLNKTIQQLFARKILPRTPRLLNDIVCEDNLNEMHICMLDDVSI